MTPDSSKPRLVFFQYQYDAQLPEFLLIHKNEHVKCLSTFFDVTVITTDGDYDAICDRLQPDLSLFEAGVNHASCRRLELANTNRHPEVPKIALHNADGFCNARAGFLSDLDRWGIETFFCISTTAAEHMPQLGDRLFTWPNCIDPTVFRDYGVWKSVPILFTGNKNSLYPWRQSILRELAGQFPILTCPHPGYDPGAVSTQVMTGERYARTLNASLVVPSCGTVARETVRKHFEIPGARACLVSERTAALELAGFADMENCVFAEARDIVDKLRYLFAHPDVLQRITDAGHHLVQTRHTMAQRDQMLQWLRLRRQMTGSSALRIVQPSPFAPLELVPAGGDRHNEPVLSRGRHLSLMAAGDEALARHDLAAADGAYLQAQTYMRWMPELKVRLAVVRLLRGAPKAARQLIAEQLRFILCTFKAKDPDPVEWAYYIVCLLCLGQVQSAWRAAERFRSLRHPFLDRIRVVTAHLAQAPLPGPMASPQTMRVSLHGLHDESPATTVARLATMLTACGQLRLAASCGDQALATESGAGDASDDPDDHAADAAAVAALGREAARADLLRLWRRRVSGLLHGVERRLGPFLPYALSQRRRDPLYELVQEHLCAEPLQRALVVGAASGAGLTEASVAACGPAGSPSVLYLNVGSRAFRRLLKRSRGWHWARLAEASAPQGWRDEFGPVDGDLRQADVDWIGIDGVSCESPLLTALLADIDFQRVIRRARFVVLEGTASAAPVLELARALADSADWETLEDDPTVRSGIAAFRRRVARPVVRPHVQNVPAGV